MSNNNKNSLKKASFKETWEDRFDKKFFISGKNALGKWIPVLIPAKCEIKQFIKTELENQKEELLDNYYENL